MTLHPFTNTNVEIDANGNAGFVNPPGPTGPAGATWRSGSGAPAAGLGVDNDFYLDTSNSDVFKKIAGAWVLQLNIKGAPGTAGTNGTNGANGIFSAIASQAEAQAGVENTKGMTPLRTKEAIAIQAAAAPAELIFTLQNPVSVFTGTVYPAAGWRDVLLNTEKLDTGNHGSLADNAMTLAAGTYDIHGTMYCKLPGPGSNIHSRLRDVTNGVTVADGLTGSVDSGTWFLVEINDRFTLAAAAALKWQIISDSDIYAQTGNWTTMSPEPKVLVKIRLTKVG